MVQGDSCLRTSDDSIYSTESGKKKRIIKHKRLAQLKRSLNSKEGYDSSYNSYENHRCDYTKNLYCDLATLTCK